MHDGTKSIPKIFANIFISFIGAGVLGVPYAFKEAGIIEGTVILAFTGFISTQAMLLLIDCKYKIIMKHAQYEKLLPVPDEKPAIKSNENSPDKEDKQLKQKVGVNHHELEFGDLGNYALGKCGNVLVDGLVVFSQIGFCCGYLIFISENLVDFMPKYSRNQYLLFMLLPLIILANIRHLKNLSIFSLFADFANIFAYCVVFWFDFEHFEKFGLPFFIGISVYCYEGAGMILSLEASVDKDHRGKFNGLFKLVMFVITTLYITFGVCGYLSFGENTKNIITLNLPNVMMFPVSRILEMRLFKNANEMDYYKCMIIRSSLVLITLAIVVCIPSFSTLMALIGSTCCILLAFILPASFHLQVFKGELNLCQRMFDYLLIFLGVVTGCVGTRDAVSRLWHENLEAQP